MNRRSGHGNEYTIPTRIQNGLVFSFHSSLAWTAWRKVVGVVNEWIRTSMYSSVLLMCKCQSKRTAVEFMAIASFNSTTCKRVNWRKKKRGKKSSLAPDKSSCSPASHPNQSQSLVEIANANLSLEFSFHIAHTRGFHSLPLASSRNCNDDYAAR